jgi:hypothetical protein
VGWGQMGDRKRGRDAKADAEAIATGLVFGL